MEQQDIFQNGEAKIILSDEPSSEEVSSGTNGSFFQDEDYNLIDNKDTINKKNLVNNLNSFTNKFEFLKNSNFIYYLYCENIASLLLINILSIIIFIIAFISKMVYKIFFVNEIFSNYCMLLISVILIPFLICTLGNMINIYNKLGLKEEENENKDLIKLIIQKWNIYYPLSLFLLTINFSVKLIMIDILMYHYKIVSIFNILIILLSLVIFGIIYYLTKSSNNILITNITDNISFSLSISVLFSFTTIICIETFKTLIYNSKIYIFLLSCLSLVLMAYYNDILSAFLIFLYQLGGIKNISFHNMNFHTFCTLINLVFIIFITFKSIKKNYFSNDEDDLYILIKEEITETNADEMSDKYI